MSVQKDGFPEMRCFHGPLLARNVSTTDESRSFLVSLAEESVRRMKSSVEKGNRDLLYRAYGQQQQQPFQHQQEMPQPRPGSNSLYQPFYLTPEPLDLNVKLRLEVRNLGHAGAKVFFECVNPAVDLMWAVEEVFRWLYTPEKFPRQ